MNANLDLERRLADYYTTEAAQRAPYRVLESVLTTTEATPQRRVGIGVPWRVPTMNIYAKVALAAVLVIAVAALGLSLFGPPVPGGVGGQPTASPSPSPIPTASPTASPSPSPVTPPPLTETFTSERHGISISYPTGWLTRPATEAWDSLPWGFEDPSGDVIHDAALADHLFLSLKSQPVGEALAATWVAETAATSECASTEPITIDGVEWAICVGGNLALVVSGGRGYQILLYTSGDDAGLESVYDRTWFEAVLATVQLLPEDAIDGAPSASP